MLDVGHLLVQVVDARATVPPVSVALTRAYQLPGAGRRQEGMIGATHTSLRIREAIRGPNRGSPPE